MSIAQRIAGRHWIALLVVLAIGVSSAARAEPQKSGPDAAAREFTIAKALQARRQFGPAAEEWTKFLKNHSSDARAAEAQYNLGICRFQDEKYAEAAAAFVQVITAYTKSEQKAFAWLHLGLAQHNQAASGQPELYAKAADNLAKYLKQFPGHAEAPKGTFFLGEALYASGKKAEAVEAYSQMIEKYPQDSLLPDAMYALGVTQEELGRLAAAGASYDAYLKRFPAGPKAADVILRRGETLFAEKHYDAAGKWFAAAAVRPGFANADLALFRQAAALYELRRYGEAAQVYASIGKKFPQSKHLQPAQLAAGKCAHLAGDLDGAQAEYKIVIEKFPDSPLAPDAYYGLAWVRMAARDYAGAVATLDALLAKHADDKIAPRARYARGVARVELKQFDPALDDVRAFLQSDPAGNDKCDAQYVLGVCQAGLNQAEDAEKTFRSILDENPRYPGGDKVLYELAWTLKSLDREQQALNAFQRLAKEYVESPLAGEAHYEVGEAAFQGARYSAAATAFHDAMQRAGKSALGEKAAYHLGCSQYRQNAFDKARQTFAYQRATWPQGSLADDAAFMEAEALFKQGKYADALPLYPHVKNPSDKSFAVLAMLHAAQAEGQLKQWQASLATLKQAARQFSDSEHLPELLCEQAWARQNLGQFGEALGLYEEVTAKSEAEVAARARCMIGEIHFQKKQYAEAIKNFFTAAYGYGYPRWQAHAHYEAGRSFEALGKSDQAIRSYQEVVEKFADSDKAASAKSRLHVLAARK